MTKTINTQKMTKAELLARIAELEANVATPEVSAEKTPAQLMVDSASVLCTTYNTALKAKEPAETLSKHMEEVITAVNNANNELKKEDFNKFLEADEPMLQAIDNGMINIVTIQQNAETGELSLANKKTLIDLWEFSQYSEKSITVRENAFEMVEALNFLTVNYNCKMTDVGSKTKNLREFALVESSFEEEFGISSAMLESISDTVKLIQTVVDAIVPGITFAPKHAHLFQRTFMQFAKGSLTKVKMSTERCFRENLLRLCHLAHTGNELVADSMKR